MTLELLSVNISQPVLEDEIMLEEKGVIEEEGMIVDEGYQSSMDCTTWKKSLVKMEEFYKQ